MIVYNINKKWILDKQDSFIDAMHRDERDSYLVSLYNYMFRKCSLKQIDTFNKLGYKAKINTHTTSYIN